METDGDGSGRARNRRGMRIGYTTGSNASGAAAAAVAALLGRDWPERVAVRLPTGEETEMVPAECHWTDDGGALCGMVKDAGDDPDVTHGALICAEANHRPESGLLIEGGEGVGRVTLPGLGLAVGEAAINPVPRQQIATNVTEMLMHIGLGGATYLAERGIQIVISVPEGERLAQKTMNGRLGILGGISILGTSGKVYPYSTAAWRASVVQAIELGAHHSRACIILATGARSERYARGIFPHLLPIAFVEISIFTGAALTACVRAGVEHIIFVGMISRIVKTAGGRMVTHVAGNPVDMAWVADVCRAIGGTTDLVEEIASANTARHVLEICQARGEMALIHELVRQAQREGERHIAQLGGRAHFEVILVDFDGTILAWAGRREGA